MHLRLIRSPLLHAILLVFGVILLGGLLDRSYRGIVGYLLSPGAWVAYGILEGNVHELHPFLITLLVQHIVLLDDLQAVARPFKESQTRKTRAGWAALIALQ